MDNSIVVVAGLIFKDNGKIFLGRRSADKHLSGFWEFPGGKVEENEEDEDCLKRELLEELGVKVSVEGFFMLHHHEYDEKDITLKSYFCKVDGDQDFTLIDHDKIEWVEVEDLLEYKLAPADIPIAKALNDRIHI